MNRLLLLLSLSGLLGCAPLGRDPNALVVPFYDAVSAISGFVSDHHQTVNDEGGDLLVAAEELAEEAAVELNNAAAAGIELARCESSVEGFDPEQAGVLVEELRGLIDTHPEALERAAEQSAVEDAFQEALEERFGQLDQWIDSFATDATTGRISCP